MTHTCQICGRDNLNLVLEGHLAPEPINAKACIPPCPGSGTDRYVREEEFQTKLKEVKTSVTSQPLNRESVTSKGDADVQAEGVSSKSTLEVSEKERIKWRARAISNESTLAAEQARSRALHEALRELLVRGSFARNGFEASQAADRAIKLLDETKQLTLAAYDTAAPLPPDTGDGELLALVAKEGTGGALISDDDGRWAFSFTGSQNAPDGAPISMDFYFFVPKEDWKDSPQEAIRAAIRAEEQTK